MGLARDAGDPTHSEERHGADFDALARGGIPRGLRIIERAVSQKSCAAVRLRVVSLQQESMLGGHPGKVPPPVFARMAHHVDFPGAFSIAQNHLEHVARRCRGDVTHRQRLFLNGALQRLPDVVKGDASLEKRFGLFGQQLPNA